MSPRRSPSRWRRALSLLAEPVSGEKRALLARRWSELDFRWHDPLQGLGRQSTGCGATVGLQPKCDFDCVGCYLGDEANTVPRAPMSEVAAQLVALRAHLGPKGNVQLTDGEVTLLPESELLAVVGQARLLGLIPMLMTHGDTLLRRDGLLDRLVEAGLTEIAVHVDSLQRGRRGAFASARSEGELEPLRDEFAERIRAARRRTGVRLRAAATLTVARANLSEIESVVRGLFLRRDVFGLVSLQPLAQVGRTRPELEGVGTAEVWDSIERALAPYGFEPGPSGLRFGHPACTRVEPMLTVEPDGGVPRIFRLVRPGCLDDGGLAARYLTSALSGLAFRDDAPLERLARGIGALTSAPGFVLAEMLPWLCRRAAEAGLSLRRVARQALRGEIRFDSFQVVSHHFMSPAEMASPEGRDRLAACVFRVPIGGRMVPMCEVNGGDGRQAVYAALRAGN